MAVTSSYLSEQLTPDGWYKTVGYVTKVLRQHIDEFDAIAFRGMSGSLIAPAVASRLKKNLIMVRRDSSSSHSDHKVEGYLSAPQRYVIVDDQVSSGQTVTSIMAAVGNAFPKEIPRTCAAVVMYQQRMSVLPVFGIQRWTLTE